MTSRSRVEPSLAGAVACSFLLHLIVAAAIAIHTPARTRRVFLPTSVSVSLVGPAPAGPKATAAAPAAAPVEASEAAPAVEIVEPPTEKKVNIAPKKEVEKPPEKVEKPPEKVEKKPEPPVEKKVEPAKPVEKPRRKRSGPTASDIMNRLRDEVASQGEPASKAGASGPSGGVAGGGGGVSAVGAAIPYKLYLYEIQSEIESAWVKPKGIENGGEGAQTIVSIRILRSGEVDNVWVEEGSGNKFFDQSVIRAIRKSSPLPPLPPAVVGDSLEVGFRFFE